MAIDLSSEHLLNLSEAAKVLPPLCGNRKVHVNTLYRWVSLGSRGVRLEAVKIGRALVTSREALQRFAERLTRDSDGARPTRVLEQTERELDRHGL